jgi:hypothetical protein
MSDTQRLNALEKRVAELERAAVLFEEHRQAWIRLENGCAQMMREDAEPKRREKRTGS